ncbi:hypothetical protein MFIFM68171_07930 [Madurella fahalii]|uniref:Uncharacterized protein n=1 Tax=Madurella fahalii TaxID=1157608 RepID=A0ABQ0GIY7_9PEZI
MALKELSWKFYFLFVAWDVLVTIPIVFFFFKETKQLSLEEIDVLFGDRATGTLAKDHDKSDLAQPEHEGRLEKEA